MVKLDDYSEDNEGVISLPSVGIQRRIAYIRFV
jgi:hypothetical protein